MFGQIGKRLVLLITCIKIFSSCIGNSSSNCKWEKLYYTERWDFIVERTYKHSYYKATYVIVTTEGKEKYFQPIQDIVAFAEKGDKIIKKPNSIYAEKINSDGDTIRSRIFSISCDSIVKKRKTNE